MATPQKARCICFCNNKGGVAKTTSAIFLAYALVAMGYRVLLIDMDPSCNATYTTTGVLNEETDGTLYEVLREKQPRPMTEIIRPSRGNTNLFIAPGSVWLQETELDLVSAQLREFKLKNALTPVLPYFHFVIIDTPPNLNLLTINALIACTDVIIPVTLKVYGLVGISILLKALDALRTNFSPYGVQLPVLGVLINQVRDTKNSRMRYKQVHDLFGETLFKAMVPLNEKVEESNDQELSGYEFAPDARGIRAYTEIAKEVIERVSKQQ